MKKITMMLLLVGITSFAQIKGNQRIETKDISIENLTSLDMSLYANVTIDTGTQTENISITTDSNLFDYIDSRVVDGVMSLAQTEWIKPSNDIQIKISAPNLEQLTLGVHETVILKNLKRESIAITALNGTIKVSGEVNSVNIKVDNGAIDAAKLQAKNAVLNIWGRGKATVNITEVLETQLSEDAELKLVTQPKEMIGDTKKAIAKANPINDKSIRYINFRIKNNSWNRNKFVVVGPKQNGGTFSYGFAMMPGVSKKERWTTGTKVYKVEKGGLRKLLVKINVSNENSIVELFE